MRHLRAFAGLGPGPVAAFCFTAALALRGLTLARESLWLDEAYSASWAREDAARLTDILLHHDYHPPAYYLLLKAWVAVLGASEVAVRMPSALFGAAAAAVAALLAWRLGGRKAALLAGLLLAVSTFHVAYSQEARMYALLSLLGALSLLTHLRLVEAPGFRRAAVHAGVLVLLLYTHAVGLFLVAAQVLHALWGWRHAAGRAPLGRLLASQAAALVLFAPWLLVMATQFGRLQHGFWIPRPTILDGALLRDHSLQGTLYSFAGSRAGAVLLLVLAGLAFLQHRVAASGTGPATGPQAAPANRASALLAWSAVFALVGPFVLSWASQPIFLARITIGAAVPLAVLAAVGACRFNWRRAGVVLFAVLLAAGLPGLARMHAQEDKERWREAVAFVEANAAANATVLLNGANIVVPFSYYAQRHDLRLVPMPGVNGTTMGAARDATVGRDAWLVVSHPAGDVQLLANAIGQGRAPPQVLSLIPEGGAMPLAANQVSVLHWPA